MAIYQTRWFERWARKHGLSEPSLCTAVDEMAKGLYDGDLGGNLFKKRIAQPGQDKSGGFRTLVATKRTNRCIYLFGFPKSGLSNIDRDEDEALKKLATQLLGLTMQALDHAKQAGELIEVICNAKVEITDP